MSTANIQELQREVIKFRDERDWKQFHTPEAVAQSVAIESAEILELFQWGKKPSKERLEEEIADVCIYILSLCDVANIDLAQAIANKIKINELKYPVEKARGNAKKYTEL